MGTMQNSRGWKRAYLVSLLPAAVLLRYVCSFFPRMVEDYYSTRINRALVSDLSTFTGYIPFSLAEITVILLAILVVWGLLRWLIGMAREKKGRKARVLHFLLDILVGISLVYVVFTLIWGLNYNRLPWADSAHLTVRPASTQVLADVCAGLINRANHLRTLVGENQNGVMRLSAGKKSSVLEDAAAGYQVAADIYPQLRGRYGHPKPVLLSKIMSYAGITGIYFPFTGEANVNMDIPDCTLPATACHEMAHQRGFAREDEANYIAYVTCNMNPSPDFQYSGTLVAVMESMSMLQEYDPARYQVLQESYSPAVRRDLKFISAYWARYEGLLEQVSNNANDLYLKSNQQKEGVYSYNRMVDLLVAEYRSNKQPY